jgi:L-ascorbate metabolism protein UlaG (beta-lactamase superfamily)
MNLLKQPRRAGEAFLARLRAFTDAADPQSFSVWWLGQSGFLLQWRGHRVLVDPYLSDSLTRKYAATDKPHVRLTARVVDPGHLSGVELVSSSHNHTDHLDAETILPLRAANPGLEILVPAANRDFAAARLGLEPESLLALDAGDRLRVGAFEVHAVPAAHEDLDVDEEGRHRYLGYVLEFEGHRVYHSGDTVRYEGMAEILQPFRVDLALLPINGARPERRVAGNLDGVEAARLAREISARCVIPCHYDLFAFNTASPTSFVAECERLGQEYCVLEQGEGWDATTSSRI